MALLEELQQKVMAVIERWRLSDDKPPYSPAELITMAMIFYGEEPASEDSILHSIGTNCRYYRHSPMSYRLDLILQDYEGYYMRDTELRNGFKAFELPASRFELEPVADELPSHALQLNLPDAQVYLQRVLGPEPKGTFPFLRLPSKLRNKIYGMVLRFRPNGVIPTSAMYTASDAPEFRMTTKDFSREFSIDEWSSLLEKCMADWCYQRPQQTLSLLSVNKQILEEALPCFYQLNIFGFISISELHAFLEHLPASRQQYITQITLSCDPNDCRFAFEAFSCLVAMPNLGKLFIDVSPKQWDDHFLHCQQEAIHFDEIPLVYFLRRLRGLKEVIFSSHTPVAIQNLEGMVESSDTGEQEENEGRDDNMVEPSKDN